NRITNSDGFGIYLHSADNTTIFQNNISFHDQTGIQIEDCTYNHISQNLIENNGGHLSFDFGIFVQGSLNSTFSRNIFKGNDWRGITLENSNETLLVQNNFSNHYIDYDAYFSTDSIDSKIYKNNFYRGCYSWENNEFNSSLIGNHWKDYSGSDSNGDGIGESSYNVLGGDYDYLPKFTPFNISDVIDPVVQIEYPDEMDLNTQNFIVNWSCNESDIDHFEIRIDDGARNYTQLLEWEYIGVDNGNHTIQIRAIDNGWNIGEDEICFTIDTMGPSISLITPTNSTYDSNNVEINATITDAHSSIILVVAELDGAQNITLSLDSGNIYTNTTITFTEGHHSLKIYAEDSLGNSNTSPLLHFTIDLPSTTPPSGIPGYDLFVILGLMAVGLVYPLMKLKSRD
ncbi:MAG: hypothetical protein GF317_04545, partial [Candidatus Lokiarchaeota archaeon]|nr:hypothetical protein [Candidatus Lokiarchaeota archaeon]MBD3199159.1 hypothetical protein [Candidatus Lokiarchaeota archaeon]